MFVATWSLDVQFGSRDEALKVIHEFGQGLKQKGFRARRTRVLLGSIGAPESRIQLVHDFDSLADLEASWSALREHADSFKAWVQALRAHVVPGSPRWEVYRLIEES